MNQGKGHSCPVPYVPFRAAALDVPSGNHYGAAAGAAAEHQIGRSGGSRSPRPIATGGGDRDRSCCSH